MRRSHQPLKFSWIWLHKLVKGEGFASLNLPLIQSHLDGRLSLSLHQMMSFFMALALFSGCALPKDQSKRIHHQAIRDPCEHLLGPIKSSESSTPQDSRSPASAHQEKLGTFSTHTRSVLEILGMVGLATDILNSQDELKHNVEGADIRALRARQKFAERISLLSFEVNKVADQMDCEKIRADHVANILSDIQGKRQHIGLMVAIVGDAAIGVIGGALALADQHTLGHAFEVLGGTLAVIFGGGTESIALEQEFRHPQNMLGEFVEGPKIPRFFPLSVWRYLTTGLAHTEDRQSMRDHIIARWKGEELLPASSSSKEEKENDDEWRRKALLLSDGGIYNIGDLRDRSQMLDELKTFVLQMDKDLLRVMREVLHG